MLTPSHFKNDDEIIWYFTNLIEENVSVELS